MPVAQPNTNRTLVPLVLVVATGLMMISGCHDGPMFALKQANPVFSMGQWEADRKLGPTDAERAAELQSLIAQIESMSLEEQQTWIGELSKIMEYDQSPYMRALAVQAAVKAAPEAALDVLDKGLEDDDAKVRITSTAALGQRREPRAVELLARTLNSEADKDVRLAAIKSLGSHRGPKVNDALKLALDETDLAYRYVTINSLKQVTGQDAGTERDAWIAVLNGQAPAVNVASDPVGWRERLGDLF